MLSSASLPSRRRSSPVPVLEASASTGAVVEASLPRAEIETHREIRNASGLNLI